MILEGIQSKDLRKIRSGAGNKKTSGVDAENKLEEVFGKKYRIRLDHQVLTDHGVFYPQALYNDLTLEITLAPASQVVKGSDKTDLKYKLTNIQLHSGPSNTRQRQRNCEQYRRSPAGNRAESRRLGQSELPYIRHLRCPVKHSE